MKDMGLVTGSEAQAKPLIVGLDTVYVHTGIEEVETEDGGTAWRYNEVQYGKDEYIHLLSEKNAALESQLTDTQLALCEVYEMLL